MLGTLWLLCLRLHLCHAMMLLTLTLMFSMSCAAPWTLLLCLLLL
jgi:hypothetical protein